jgi:hypothetical protein
MKRMWVFRKFKRFEQTDLASLFFFLLWIAAIFWCYKENWRNECHCHVISTYFLFLGDVNTHSHTSHLPPRFLQKLPAVAVFGRSSSSDNNDDYCCLGSSSSSNNQPTFQRKKKMPQQAATNEFMYVVKQLCKATYTWGRSVGRSS